MDKKTILVTGGAGYIGSFMVSELLDKGYKVVVLDSLENGHREAVDKRAALEVVNLDDKTATDAVFKTWQPAAVIDFAAYLAVGESMEEPVKYIKNNVLNFIQLLDVMKENGCNYIIKSSTASSYGNPEDKYFPLKEDYQEVYKPKESALLSGKWSDSIIAGDDELVEGEKFFQKIIDYYHTVISDRPELRLTDDELTKLRIPASVYGLTKVLDEILMKKYEEFSPIKHVALRYFNVSGAALDGEKGEDKPKPTTLMTVCYWNILGRIPELSVFGADYPTKDGTGVRDYIHPLDLATGHLAALAYLMKGGGSQTINLGTGQGYSVFEVMKAVEQASGKKISYRVAGRRSGDPAVSYANPGKASELLGWKAKYNLKDMAESAWKWHSKYPDGYN